MNNIFINLVNSQYCYQGCSPGRFGCQCDQICGCDTDLYDCIDGPSGTGKCVCKYGKWEECGEMNRLNLETNLDFEFQTPCVFSLIKLSKYNHLYSGKFTDLKFCENTSKTPRYLKGERCNAVHVLPEDTKTELILFNKQAGKHLLLHENDLFIDQLSGTSPLLKNSEPFARAYSGHQFGSYSGQLGDGRAITLGFAADGTQEISVKGAGRTVFSRAGDGKAVLKNLIREYLGSACLKGLGIPVVEALAVFENQDDAIHRDEFYNGDGKMFKSGRLVRVAPSFLRFGSVEFLSDNGDSAGLVGILQRAVQVVTGVQPTKMMLELSESFNDSVTEKCYFINDSKQLDGVLIHDVDDTHFTRRLALSYFKFITERSAALVAAWQTNGFAHGVMNTDNISLIGLTIDLNVFGFITNFNTEFTPNYIDSESRYKFGDQAKRMKWNLQKLADALLKIFGGPENIENGRTYDLGYSNVLSKFDDKHQFCFETRMKQKLGMSDFSNVESFLKSTTDKNYHLESSRLSGKTPKYVFSQKRVLAAIEDFMLTGSTDLIENVFERLQNPFTGVLDISETVDGNSKTSCGAQ